MTRWRTLFLLALAELADPRYLGTALTLQICLGFLLTTASIALVGVLRSTVGWRWAFAALAPGPALGVVAMLRLRSLPGMESTGPMLTKTSARKVFSEVLQPPA